jgi:hypothetical protein
MKLTVNLTGPQEQALAEVAGRLRLRPEELAAALVRDLVSAPSADFESAARKVLEKNAELYRRLS